jgi:hypothetical protein
MEKIQEKEEQRHFSVGGETSQRSPGCSVAYALKKRKRGRPCLYLSEDELEWWEEAE